VTKVITVEHVATWLQQFAPVGLAESWDHVGLLLGDPATRLERVMTCLTVTEATAQEAVTERVGLVVSHHPILFRDARQIRADLPGTAAVWALARAGISVYSPHTALDNTAGGINDLLCRRFGLVDCVPLRPLPGPNSFKVVVFTPESDRDSVLEAAFAAGAGRIGRYSECSFATPGEGTFFGSEESQPAVGQKGRRETVVELRLEVVCPAERLASVLSAIRGRHSYEEPAIDVYPLHTPPEDRGAGRIGRYLEPRPLSEFAAIVAANLGHVRVQQVGDPGRKVQKVAVVCGAGDDFIGDAAAADADVLVTGEARFHRVLEAEALGIGLILAGHYATERPGVEELARRIAGTFPDLQVWPSQFERDPLRASH